MPQRITDFADIKDEFIERVEDAVWCNAATVDSQNRPQSRVLHPIWEGPVGWVAVNRESPKAKHLAANPYISLAYIKDPMKPVYAECGALWEDDQAIKERIWELFKSTPEPVGYDPGMIWKNAQDPKYGLLKLEPWLIRLYDLLNQNSHRIWRA
ncbi:MAG: pyridoxamine 5'-phosphate oxidase family protein [Chloroflexota bacterium]